MSSDYDPDDRDFFVRMNLMSLQGWIDTGVAQTMKLYSADDENVCPACRAHAGKILPITTPEEQRAAAKFLMTLSCTSHQCRCYVRPEDLT